MAKKAKRKNRKKSRQKASARTGRKGRAAAGAVAPDTPEVATAPTFAVGKNFKVVHGNGNCSTVEGSYLNGNPRFLNGCKAVTDLATGKTVWKARAA